VSELEQELECDLRRVAAPDGFADAVMARLPSRTRHKWSARPWFARRSIFRLWPAFATGMLLAALVGGYLVHQRQQRELAALTEARFEVAMRIASRTLNRVDEEVSRAGVKPALRSQDSSTN
jgi:hypothetical protein